MSKKLLTICSAALLAVSSVAYGQSTTPISQLPGASTPLAGSEQVPCVQGGVTKSCLASAIAGQSSGISSGLINGVTSGSNAPAGVVGEYQSATTNGTSLPTGGVTVVACTSLTLPPGDWDVQGIIQYVQSANGTVTGYALGVSTISNAFNTFVTQNTMQSTQSNGVTFGMDTPVVRENITTNTTIYAVTTVSFTSGTVTCNGFLRARRVR